MSGANSRQFSRGDFPLGRKWTVARRTVRGFAWGTAVNETPDHSIVLPGAHWPCSSTTARVAFDGAR